MDERALHKVAERAKAYRDAHRMKDRSNDDINRTRVLLFFALDELEESARIRPPPMDPPVEP